MSMMKSMTWKRCTWLSSTMTMIRYVVQVLVLVEQKAFSEFLQVRPDFLE